MRRSALLAVWLLLGGSAIAQTNCDEGAGRLNPAQPTAIQPADIIQKFAANEALFEQARKGYSYTQDLIIQTLGANRRFGTGPPVSGELRLVADVSYDTQGRRIEKVTFAPESSLRVISVTRDDFADIQSLAGFLLTPGELPQYDIRFAGQQHVDEIDTYAFDVSPAHIKKGQRYFEGRIWVDAHDVAIVKSCGKRVPDQRDKRQENLSPKFVIYREQINGKFWFPTYMRADDLLRFRTGPVHVRETVKFTQYQPVGAAVPVSVPSSAPPAAEKKP
jgi:hypothetical protein